MTEEERAYYHRRMTQELNTAQLSRAPARSIHNELANRYLRLCRENDATAKPDGRTSLLSRLTRWLSAATRN